MSKADRLREAIAKAQANHEAKQAAASPKSSILKGPPSVTAEDFGTIYLRGAKAELDRAKRWVEISRLFSDRADPHMAFQLQECGFLDTMLLAFESEVRTDPGPEPGNRYIVGQAFEFVLGDCWLLFIYEVFRTLRSSDRFSQLPSAQQDSFATFRAWVECGKLPRPLPDCGKFDLKAIDAALDRISGLGNATNALDAWRERRTIGGSHAG